MMRSYKQFGLPVLPIALALSALLGVGLIVRVAAHWRTSGESVILWTGVLLCVGPVIFILAARWSSRVALHRAEESFSDNRIPARVLESVRRNTDDTSVLQNSETVHVEKAQTALERVALDHYSRRRSSGSRDIDLLEPNSKSSLRPEPMVTDTRGDQSAE